MREGAQLLIYGQAKTNVLSSRYICTEIEAAELAASMLQISNGDWNPKKCQKGYLKNAEKLQTLIPYHLIPKKKFSEWEELITAKYQQLKGFQKVIARQG